MRESQDERRTESRRDLVRPCKLYDPLTRKYVAGTTWNVSCEGALIELPRARDLQPGDQVYLGVAWKRREGVLPRMSMIKGEVVRTALSPQQHTLAALRLHEPLALPLERKRSYHRAA
jgi:hypothetical protein